MARISFIRFVSSRQDSVRISPIISNANGSLSYRAFVLISNVALNSFSFTFVTSLYNSNDVTIPPVCMLISLKSSPYPCFFVSIMPSADCKIPTYGRSSSCTSDISKRISAYPIPFVSISWKITGTSASLISSLIIGWIFLEISSLFKTGIFSRSSGESSSDW